MIISGRVQGVFFRYTTQMNAQEKELTGWVENLPTGEVECLFEGEQVCVREMIEWCRRGPAGAHVENVEVAYQKYRGEFDSFSIR